MTTMQFDFDVQSYEAKRFDKDTDPDWPYPDEMFLDIKPYPNSMANIILDDGGIRLTGADKLKAFDYCLAGFGGVVGKNDKPVACSQENKKFMFDFNFGMDAENGIPPISTYVLNKSRDFHLQKRDALKN